MPSVDLDCPAASSLLVALRLRVPDFSLFEERLPIGLMSVIKTVPAETVRAFYARHYHPERMSVVAVGDFADAGKGVVRERGEEEGSPQVVSVMWCRSGLRFGGWCCW